VQNCGPFLQEIIVSTETNAEINLLKVKLEAQKKDKTIFFLIGLILGGVIMFFVTNRLNSNSAMVAQASGSGVSQLPGADGPMPNDKVHEGAGVGAGGAGGPQPEIRAILQKAKDNPNDVEAQLNAADQYLKIGRSEQALDYLSKAYALKPDGMEFRPLVVYAELLLDGDKVKEAMPLFEKVIKMKPEESIGYIGLGMAYRKQKDFDKSIAQFNTALKIQPKDEDALHELAHAYIDKGDARNAETTINRLNEINSKNENIASLRQELDQLKLTGKIPSH